MNLMEKRGVHAFFSGLVQGIGFRFTARSLAQRHNIKGEVSNLPDGRVELIAEGDNKDLAALLRELQTEFGRNITGTEVQEIPVTGSYNDFQIQFY